MPRKINEEALRRALAHDRNGWPYSSAKGIIAQYLEACTVVEYARNPKLLLLSTLKADGVTAPWPYTFELKNGKSYLRSADTRRARQLMGNPSAQWELFEDRRSDKRFNGVPCYTRVRRTA